MSAEKIVEERLNIAVELLQNLLALELSKKNVPQAMICKHLHVTNAKVGKMFEGVRNEK